MLMIGLISSVAAMAWMTLMKWLRLSQILGWTLVVILVGMIGFELYVFAIWVGFGYGVL
jgi:hypothetical protein